MAANAPQSFASVLEDLYSGRALPDATFRTLAADMIANRMSEPRIAALLVMLRMRGESASELQVLSEEILQGSRRFDLKSEALDVCGTGGGKPRHEGAANVSTISSLVLAALGVTICKHGGGASSSTSGSSDLLTALGIDVQVEPTQQDRLLRETDWSYCFGPHYHPHLRHLGPIRKGLSVMTSMNCVLPLVHPGAPTHRLLGVSDPRLLSPIAEVLRKREITRALVVSGPNGLDELGVQGANRIIEIRDGDVTESSVSFSDLSGVDVAEVRGGDAETNARRARSVLAGEASPMLETIALNAGAGLYTFGKAATLAEGYRLAKEGLLDGAASDIVDRIIAAQQGLGD